MGAMRLHRYEIAPALCETAVSRSLRNVRKLHEVGAVGAYNVPDKRNSHALTDHS